MANASPNAIVRTVDVVGAIRMVQASGACVSNNLKSAAFIRVLFSKEDITAVGILNLLACAKMSFNSVVSPELEISKQKSSGVIIPKSP